MRDPLGRHYLHFLEQNNITMGKGLGSVHRQNRLPHQRLSLQSIRIVTTSKAAMVFVAPMRPRMIATHRDGQRLSPEDFHLFEDIGPVPRQNSQRLTIQFGGHNNVHGPCATNASKVPSFSTLIKGPTTKACL